MSEEKNFDGTMNLNGIDLRIGDILGDKLVDQYIGRLTDDDMNLLFKACDEMIFNEEYDYATKGGKKVVRLTQTRKNSYGSTITEDVPFWKYTQKEINERFQNIIKDRVVKLLESDEYKKKAEQIAQDIVDYAMEGYKEDMKERIRERMIGNILDTTPSYTSVSLTSLIERIIEQKIHFD